MENRHYLITVDYFSSFIEVDQLKTNQTSGEVVTKLKVQFARYGIPTELISEGGPQFTSAEFKRFLDEWGVSHTLSSPLYPLSNGKAEAAVKTVKHIMAKCSMDGRNVYYAFLELRNTPRQDTGLSPNQMLFGRATQTKLPAVMSDATSIKNNSKTHRNDGKRGR